MSSALEWCRRESVPSPLKSPMNRAQETQNRSPIADLQRLKQMQQLRGVFLIEQHAVSGGRVVDFPGAVDGGHGSEEVGDCAGEAHVVCFAGHVAEAECFSDDVLYALVARSEGHWRVCTYHVVLQSGAHFTTALLRLFFDTDFACHATYRRRGGDCLGCCFDLLLGVLRLCLLLVVGEGTANDGRLNGLQGG